MNTERMARPPELEESCSCMQVHLQGWQPDNVPNLHMCWCQSLCKPKLHYTNPARRTDGFCTSPPPAWRSGLPGTWRDCEDESGARHTETYTSVVLASRTAWQPSQFRALASARWRAAVCRLPAPFRT